MQHLPADARVLAVGRRAPAMQDARIVAVLGALESDDLHARLDAALVVHPPAAFVCALGTTLRQAGSGRAFAVLDRDALIALASGD